MAANVLLIDDDAIIRILAMRTLQRHGIDADAAVGAEEGIRLLQHAAYEVVIVDLYMPGMDGFAMLDWLRQHRPEVVSMVLSGTTRVEDVIQAMHHGAFDFVTKPIDQYEVFVQQVRRALDHKQLRDSHDRLVGELQQKNIELENRLGQLEMAHNILQSQARAIQASLRRAERIQQALLPAELPFHDRVSLAAYFQPSDKVGGDFYDVFALDERHLGLYLADTSGHGVGSALVTAYLKYAIQPVDRSGGDSCIVEPGKLLRRMNARFCEGPFGHDLFVSITYMILDTVTFKLQYANAGHPPLLVRHRDGRIEELRIPAPALGINPDVKHSTGTYQLRPEDVLTAYTDGVIDAENASGQFYGRAGLRAFLTTAPAEPAAIAKAFEKALQTFHQPVPLADDTTLLALAIRPQATAAIPRLPAFELAQEPEEAAGPGLMSASEQGVTFVSIAGSGTWVESRHVADLFEEARHRGDRLFLLDFTRCNHLDSTFHGVLHNLCTEAEKAPGLEVQLQNLPRALLREISELGLTTVLMHFSSNSRALPEAMAAVSKPRHSETEMGQFLLNAHEALVNADPRNADRFAAVLQVLHDRATHKPRPDALHETQVSGAPHPEASR